MNNLYYFLLLVPFNVCAMQLPQAIAQCTPSTPISVPVMQLTTEYWILTAALDVPTPQLTEYYKESSHEELQPWKRYTRSIPPRMFLTYGQYVNNYEHYTQINAELAGIQHLKEQSFNALHSSLQKIRNQKKKKCLEAFIVKKQSELEQKKKCLPSNGVKTLVDQQDYVTCLNDRTVEKQVELMVHGAMHGFEKLKEIKKNPSQRTKIYNPSITLTKDRTQKLHMDVDFNELKIIHAPEEKSFFGEWAKSLCTFFYALGCKKSKCE